VASRSAGLLVRRGSYRGRPSVAPSARSRERDGRGLRPRRWHAGDLPRGVDSRTGTVCRGGCPPRHCSGRGSYGKGSPEQCQGGTPRREREVDLYGPVASARPGERQNPACSCLLSLSLSLNAATISDPCPWSLSLSRRRAQTRQGRGSGRRRGRGSGRGSSRDRDRDRSGAGTDPALIQAVPTTPSS